MTLNSGAMISLQRVGRRFRRGAESVQALDEVSLELYGGELAVAAGPSGSGKTTLLSVMAGLERVDAGRMVVHPPLPHRPGWRHLALIPQALALLDELTVAENVTLPAVLDPAADRPRQSAPDPAGPADQATGRADPATTITAAAATTAELLDRLEIGHLADRYPSHTSGGEQQRTAIARALRLRPAVLLGDEPTGHQDRARVDLVLTVLRQHAYNGAAVLITSHDQEVIEAADRVITLADGRIVSDTRAETAVST